MSDRGYAIFVTAAKYAFVNFFATILWVVLAQAGWIYSEEAIVLIYLIINSTALVLGKMQKLMDKLKEIEKIQEKSKNNA